MFWGSSWRSPVLQLPGDCPALPAPSQVLQQPGPVHLQSPAQGPFGCTHLSPKKKKGGRDCSVPACLISSGMLKWLLWLARSHNSNSNHSCPAHGSRTIQHLCLSFPSFLGDSALAAAWGNIVLSYDKHRASPKLHSSLFEAELVKNGRKCWDFGPSQLPVWGHHTKIASDSLFCHARNNFYLSDTNVTHIKRRKKAANQNNSP